MLAVIYLFILLKSQMSVLCRHRHTRSYLSIRNPAGLAFPQRSVIKFDRDLKHNFLFPYISTQSNTKSDSCRSSEGK